MGTHQPAGLIRLLSRRAASLIMVGVLPLSVGVIGAGAATAESQPVDTLTLTAVAVETPDGRVRIGTIQVDRPAWLSPEQGAQINAAAADTQNALARGLESAGLEPARSDLIAENVIGSAAVGAAVGAAVASPIATLGAVIGAVVGLVAGLPFAPAGLLVVPVLGATLAYGMVTAPFVAAGAAIGAGVGAVTGSLAPLPVTTDEQPATS